MTDFAWCGLFTDRTSAGKCMVFLLSPALIFRRRSRNYQLVIYILLLSVMVFMAHAATARIITVLYIAFMASISSPASSDGDPHFLSLVRFYGRGFDGMR